MAIDIFDLPIKNVIFQFVMLVYQRVTAHFSGENPNFHQEKLRQTKGTVEQATAVAAAATKRRLRPLRCNQRWQAGRTYFKYL